MGKDCSCGRSYENETGVKLCERNQHGDGKDEFGKALQFRHTIEQEFSVVCAECLRPLRFQMRVIEGTMIEFNVLPHVCEVGEDDAKGGRD